ncbi:MAG: BlaI/MecI/CopY family transcriptional regulator [Tepidisphaeraceae bacterium]|jgi:predicted transcriptional regulator
MANLPILSRRESQIMEIVYARGEVTATEVLAAMPDPLSRAAVRTFLRILEDKGQLTHRRVGRHFVFRAIRARKQAGQSALRRVLDVFFRGSLEQAVAAYLADETGEYNPDELEKMAALIRKARKDGQ